ncbi:hypothetical protein NA8A_07934 [Nitratireductor indicus C115]|uniref:Uncharacterized protein n=1 Tax=Nitratireductor indicus C115 TaxID=1231190 RepID=K2NV99_9HYPH|nr:hypothetical protein NA8A_07934 [Nitratireductor indicus C115]
MPGSHGATLAKTFYVFKGDVRVTGKVEESVLKHGSMAVRQDKSIAIVPVGISGIEFKNPGKQYTG